MTDRAPSAWLMPVTGKIGVFRASGIARTISSQSPIDVECSPFFSMHRRNYAAYWELYTLGELKTRAAELSSERERIKALEAATIVMVDPGTRVASETQPQSSVSRFYESEYAIPAELVRDRNTITVRFEATNGLEVTPVFGVRLIKK